jgi:hypothetical protein
MATAGCSVQCSVREVVSIILLFYFLPATLLHGWRKLEYVVSFGGEIWSRYVDEGRVSVDWRIILTSSVEYVNYIRLAQDKIPRLPRIDIVGAFQNVVLGRVYESDLFAISYCVLVINNSGGIIIIYINKNVNVRLFKILNLRKFFTDCFEILTQRCIRIHACFYVPVLYRCHTCDR